MTQVAWATPARSRASMAALAVAFWAAFGADAAAQGSVASDRAALEAFYDATGGPGWANRTSWKTSAPLHEWYGVGTDGAGRVTSLNVRENGLTGTVPPALGNLAELDWLDLGGNALTGAIPATLGRLARLQGLILWRNELTGPVPAELGSLVELRLLHLGENGLTGAIPRTLGSLANLEELYLDGNELTGPIPAALGNPVSLRLLHLGRNGLAGTIPGTLGRLANLEELGLAGNELTGRIPAALGYLTELEWLDLGGNALTGAIPDTLERPAKLRRLSLWGNELTGPVPAWLGSLVELRFLHLGGNALTGAIPGTLGRLANLESLHLDRNDLTGPVPSPLGRLANLRTLALEHNPLTGALPRSLIGLSRLSRLDVTGTAVCAPADPAFQAWLATIDFHGDLCTAPPEPVGAIPAQTLTEEGPALGVSVAAYFSDPDDDPLTYAAASSHPGTVSVLVSGDTVWLVPGAAGTAAVTVTARDSEGLSAAQAMAVTVVATAAPQSDREVLEALYDATGGADWTDRTSWKTSAPLGEWYGVTLDDRGRIIALELEGNGLTGAIPPSLGNLVALRTLNLADNSLAGPIPGALAGLADLEWLTLAGNALIGPVPPWLGSLTALRGLLLWGNALAGPIPGALAGLADLEWLFLSRNALTGPVPPWLGNLTALRGLWLADNALTGPIPGSLGNLAHLEQLDLGGNRLTGGPFPAWLGNLVALRRLNLFDSGLTGPIPGPLRSLAHLEELNLAYNWGLSGRPPDLPARLERLDIFATSACAPAAWRDRLAAIEFGGRLCGDRGDVTIDVAVVYTPAARASAGGTAAMEALVDLLVAETNRGYEESGVRHRVALVNRSLVDYAETGNTRLDFVRLEDPSDGHLDEVHALRERVEADLVHLLVSAQSGIGGIADLYGPFGVTTHDSGGVVFAHELGHNMGLWHDRYQVHRHENPVSSHPAYGYVNPRGLTAGAPRSSRWRTAMSYSTRCADAALRCTPLLRFSNPRQGLDDDPLGVPFRVGSGVTGPADAVAVLNATGPAVALWRGRLGSGNRPPVVTGTLPDRRMALGRTLELDMSPVFRDPDRGVLGYTVSSSAPRVVTGVAAGARVRLTAVGLGRTAITVTATDPGGLAAVRTFTVAVSPQAPFTDHPLEPGITPVRAVHFTELRTRIDAARRAAGLGPHPWTDPVLSAGTTPIRLVHLRELRSALGEAYRAAGLPAPRWTDAVAMVGATPIRADHLMELRAAVLELP